MKVNQIRFKIKDFRAIKEADIILDGITLVAGENGCGKSTLSKFLYYVFKISNEYEELIDEGLKNRLKKHLYYLEDAFDETRRYSFREIVNKDKERSIYKKDRELFDTLLNKLRRNHSQEQSDWFFLIDKLSEIYSSQKSENDLYTQKRSHNILKDILDERSDQEMDMKDLLESLKSDIQNSFDTAEKRKRERPSSLLINHLSSLFYGDQLPKEYSVFEYDNLIISNDDINFLKPHSIQQIVYIDTPMLLGLGVSDKRYSYWKDVNHVLQEGSIIKDYNNSINSIINKNILSGETSFERDRSGLQEAFIYKREDGSEFNLLDCATGVKSFAMLQMMLKNGFLNKYTLLIIDEPESHLHPQWIIEYARLIVLLNKHVGVKFFLASHNPDMVSAIKYISEKEEVEAKLNFYIAERDGSSYTYWYRHLGTDIEPIFESFNIALDRISQYGTKEEN